VPATTEAGSSHVDRADRSQCCAINCRVRLRSCCVSLRRPIEQRPDHRPQLSCPPPLRVAEPTTKERKETRAAHSPFVPTSTVAGWDHADHANRGQTSVLTFRAPHHIGWLSPRRPSEQTTKQRPYMSCHHHRCWLSPRRTTELRPHERPHNSCPPPQWLCEPTPTKRSASKAAPSTVVHATSVAG
jgi:hypothetical protein